MRGEKREDEEGRREEEVRRGGIRRISRENLLSFRLKSIVTVVGSDLLTLVPTTSQVVFLIYVMISR